MQPLMTIPENCMFDANMQMTVNLMGAIVVPHRQRFDLYGHFTSYYYTKYSINLFYLFDARDQSHTSNSSSEFMRASPR